MNVFLFCNAHDSGWFHVTYIITSLLGYWGARTAHMLSCLYCCKHILILNSLVKEPYVCYPYPKFCLGGDIGTAVHCPSIHSMWNYFTDFLGNVHYDKGVCLVDASLFRCWSNPRWPTGSHFLIFTKCWISS